MFERQESKKRIELENRQMLQRMIGVKSSLPSNKDLKAHFKNHQRLKKNIKKVRYGTPSHSARSRSPQSNRSGRRFIDASRMPDSMARL